MQKNYSHRFQEWLSNRWPLVLLVLLIMFGWVFEVWVERPLPCITRTIGTSTQHVNTLWFKQNFYSLMATGSDGRVFLMSTIFDNLSAIDSENGNTIWDIKLPFEKSGARGFLANEDTVFVITTINVDAYKAETGEREWSTKLGDGHVGIISQLDSDRLRIYYGDAILEIDVETGEILNSYPKDNTIWIFGNTVLKTAEPYGINRFNKQTGVFLWKQRQAFYIRENFVPQNLGEDILYVPVRSSSICALNLLTGEYDWCRPEKFNSGIAIDYQSQYGYALRDDNVLLRLNLATGDILSETSFLSSELPSSETGTFASIAVSNGNIIISFVDSQQTFGLKFVDRVSFSETSP
jgi:outer membrane protein assembly factor BamB